MESSRVVERCSKCILPLTYTDIKIDENGICNLCNNHKDIEYSGSESLKNMIEEILNSVEDRNQTYDCVIGFSGGRDSSYLLYYCVEVLNLKVVAYTASHDYIPPITLQNMKEITHNLGVKHVIEYSDDLKKCLKHILKSWTKKPSLKLIETFCTGCRLNIQRGISNYARTNRIPIVFLGGTPFEGVSYRENLLYMNVFGVKSRIFGYLNEVVKNPSFILNYDYLKTQLLEYYYYFYPKHVFRDIHKIGPFFDKIRWDEKEITSVIEDKLDWKKNPESDSNWRSDCDIASLKLYLYKQILGYNDKVAGLSNLIRDNQVSREEALERLYEEEEISEDLIEGLFEKCGLSFSNFQISLSNYLNENQYS